MAYKQTILSLLDDLKKMGKTRRIIEVDLKYSPKYLDQVVSMGGNEKVLQALSLYKDTLELQQGILNDAPAQYLPEKELIELQKDLISELRKEKLQWQEDKRKLEQKLEALETRLAASESRNEFLEAKAIQKSKRTRSA